MGKKSLKVWTLYYHLALGKGIFGYYKYSYEMINSVLTVRKRQVKGLE